MNSVPVIDYMSILKPEIIPVSKHFKHVVFDPRIQTISQDESTLPLSPLTPQTHTQLLSSSSISSCSVFSPLKFESNPEIIKDLEEVKLSLMMMKFTEEKFYEELGKRRRKS